MIRRVELISVKFCSRRHPRARARGRKPTVGTPRAEEQPPNWKGGASRADGSSGQEERAGQGKAGLRTIPPGEDQPPIQGGESSTDLDASGSPKLW